MKNLCLITYSNSNMKDVWESHFLRIRKHFKTDSKVYCISDIEVDNVDKTFIYNNDEPYYKAWVDCLESIEEDYFIYLQEDLILHKDVPIDIIKNYIEVMKEDGYVDFIRLIKSGKGFSEKQFSDGLYYVNRESYPQFSMQPTIWKKKRFIDLYKNVKAEKWFECQEYEDACVNLNINGLYSYRGESSRGNHFDSSVYPYIATAIIKGKWNLSEYPEELFELSTEYNININDRGVK